MTLQDGESLAAEQTAVYRTVLQDIQKDSEDTLNLGRWPHLNATLRF
jgi:hypothetical protein